jgi:DNA-binding LytR/AlgR family response regulator
MTDASRKPTALIVDDEDTMRDALRARLAEVWPELVIVGEAGNGIDAVAQAGALNPDIVFLDIRMPGLNGIDAARLLFNRCHIVLVTAYDQYAIQAFEQGAMDYLLKPVDAARLAKTCERLRLRLDDAPRNVERFLSQLSQSNDAGHGGAAKKSGYLRWIQASVGSSVRMISTREVLFFRADEKYTRVQTDQMQVLIRKTLKELEDELDPSEFWRIHRSTLVRVDAIAEVTRDMRGRQLVSLRNHSEKLEVSRAYGHLFQQM